MSKFTYNQCKVCGGDLIHNQETGKYICKYCGNQYTLNENNVLQQITVKDLDDQRTKIVDDIKGVINDTYIKDKKEINTLIEERDKKLEEASRKKIKRKNIWFWTLWSFLTFMAFAMLVIIMINIGNSLFAIEEYLFIGGGFCIFTATSIIMLVKRKKSKIKKEFTN